MNITNSTFRKSGLQNNTAGAVDGNVHNAIAAYQHWKFQSLTYDFLTANIINITHITNEYSIIVNNE
jgi:hypothetical protein